MLGTRWSEAKICLAMTSTAKQLFSEGLAEVSAIASGVGLRALRPTIPSGNRKAGLRGHSGES